MNELGTDEADCCRRVSSGSKVAGAIKNLVNFKGLQLECTSFFYESLFVPVFMYGSETMI